MKLYYNSIRPGDLWQLPGHQDKAASKVEIPTDAAGLCAWLNARRVPICLALVKPELSAEQAYGFDPTQPEPGPAPEPDKPAIPLPSFAHQSVAIDDAWAALPLARKLHFAALAMEDARAQL